MGQGEEAALSSGDQEISAGQGINLKLSQIFKPLIHRPMHKVVSALGDFGVPGKIRTCDLPLHTSTAFAARLFGPFEVWTLSSPVGSGL